MKKKKILFVTNIPAPYRIDFFNKLGEKYDLTVLFEAKRAKGIRFNWNEDTITNFKAYFLNAGEIEEKKVDLRIFSYLCQDFDEIVFTSYGYYTELAGILMMILRKKAFYLELDGCSFPQKEKWIKEKLKSLIINSAKGIFSSGKKTDGTLSHYGASAEKLIRYPFTSLTKQDLVDHVPTEYEKTAAKKKLGFDCGFLVLGAGQFIYRKGFDLLLQAAKNFSGDVAFCIAGAEPDDIFKMHAEEIENIVFPGFLSKEELKEYMLAADLFVLPTREDMWGLVVNESMSRALPVISTEGCIAACELIRDGVDGKIVPVNDFTAIESTIRELYNNRSLLHDMAENSLRRISEYTIEKMVSVHVSVFGGAEI